MKIAILSLLPIAAAAANSAGSVRRHRRTAEKKSAKTFDLKKTTPVKEDTVAEDNQFNVRLLQDLSMATPAPTPAPTPKPTIDEQCGLELQIFCQTNQDPPIPCDDIPTPADPTCAVGDKLDAIELSWEDRSCDESNNGQGDNFSCTDFPDVTVDGEAELTCYNRDDPSEIVCQCTTISKATITGPQQVLPDWTTCEIRDSATKELAQTITFKSDGTTDLRLGDTFGMIKIDGCSDVNNNFIDKQCCYEVNYIYVLQNTGPEFTISEYEREWVERDSTKNLLPSLSPEQRIVQSGQFAPTLQEPGLIDVCKTAKYTTKLEATTVNVDCYNETEIVNTFQGIPPRE